MLARTFLEVIAAGNFQAAAQNLFVTQSAVSLRIKRLEDELGRPVFTRTKSGAQLTPAGEQFERFARSMVRLWEEARYQVAVPAGLQSLLLIGCQYSLWPKLGMPWLRQIEEQMLETAIRAEVGMPDRLLRLMMDGLLDIAVMYTPQLRPGLEVRPLLDDTLVLVSTDPDYPAELDERYVSIDWSPEFRALQTTHFSCDLLSRVTLALGSLSVLYVLSNGRAAYFPARVVEEHVAAGRLHVVAGAPAFPFPAYVVWNPEKDADMIDQAMKLLRKVGEDADRRQHELVDEAGVTEIDDRLLPETDQSA
ncbi:MAG: LysR family transcriptional regulator [Pseudomonadota bacterium]